MANDKQNKQRRFYLDGYAQHPEWYTWHYEMLKKLEDIDINTSNTSISFENTAQDSFGRLRVSEPFTLFDSSHRYRDNGLWNTLDTIGGTAVFSANEGLVNLNVTSTGGSQVVRETAKVFSYQPGKSL